MKKQTGFTLVELIIVMVIFSSLIGFVTLNLVTIQRKTTLDSVVSQLTADLSLQQEKAMIGDTDGGTSPNTYGIHFLQSSYVLFHGTSYSQSDSTNETITIDSALQFANSGSDIIFSRLSGNVYNYNAAANTITLIDSTNNKQKTMTFNRYGIITQVN